MTTTSAPPAGTAALGRAAALACGAAGMALAAAWIWLFGRHEGQFVLAQGDWILATLPSWLVYAVFMAIVIGLVAMLTALRLDPRLRCAIVWCWTAARRHPWLALVFVIAILGGGLDVYELVYDPFNNVRGLRAWMVRQDLQGWLNLGAAVLAGLAVSALVGQQSSFGGIARRIQICLMPQGRIGPWPVVAVLAPAGLGAAMALWALDGIPHFSDSLTYLIQGRMLRHGQLYMSAPSHTYLFEGSLFFVATDGRFFGKYPLGWPAILGAFDGLGLGFAANAVLAAVATVLTGLLARQFAPRRVAITAALLFGASPWIWFNGANFASHMASACAVTAFLWLMLRTLRSGGAGSALSAGLCLGAAVLVRPADAAMFALPAVIVMAQRVIRQPRRWLGPGLLIAVTTLIGVVIYFGQNAFTTGSAFVSPYTLEPRWGGDWDRSAIDVLGRLWFQWAELNRHFPGWGVGAVTVAVAGALAAGSRWRHVGLRLVTASSVIFFLANAAFGFTTVWWGPRWLVPVTPLLAILAAEWVNRMWRQSLRPSGTTSAACQMGLCVLVGGLAVGLMGVFAGQWYQHRLMPPHAVSAAAHTRAIEMQLQNAVVAMPTRGERPPQDARAGMAFLQVPFESNPVIYVRAFSDWAHHAGKTYPGRQLYELHPDPKARDGFVIERVIGH